MTGQKRGLRRFSHRARQKKPVNCGPRFRRRFRHRARNFCELEANSAALLFLRTTIDSEMRTTPTQLLRVYLVLRISDKRRILVYIALYSR